MSLNDTSAGWSLSVAAIRRHIATLALTLMVVVLGLFFASRLRVDLLPSITYPRIGVRLEAEGIAPEVAVDEITRPLEQALAATEGVQQVFSQTREGQVQIDLYFRPGGNIDRALNDATAAYNRGRGRLPDGLPEPRIFKFDPSQLPVYEFALTSDLLSPLELRVLADEEIARELSVVPGVALADVSGGVREEIQVQVDLNRLQASGVGLTDVLNDLARRNQDISGGRLLGSATEPLTRTLGRFSSAQEIENLSFEVMGARDSAIAAAPDILPRSPQRVYLRDLAQVTDGVEEQRIFVNLNGQPAVKISVQKQPDANTVMVVNDVKAKLEELKQSGLITDDLTVVETLDESRFIRNSIQNVASAGLIGTGLAAIAVLLFLGSLRQTLIIVLAIPLATLAAVILMALFGLSLNIFSLGGLALGVGIVVDNSIVMLETIVEGVRQRQVNRPDLITAAAEQNSRLVESALVASTSTNLVAVVPFLLLGGFVSLLFNELVLTISFAVAASILVALTVVPALTARLLSISWSSGIGNTWLLRTFDRRFTQTMQGYQVVLSRILPYRVLILIMAFLVLGGGSWLLAGQIPQEVLPSISTEQARLVVQFPPGTTLEENQEVMTIADNILLEQPETEYVFTTSGGFLFGQTATANALRGSSTITLKPNTNVEAYVERVSETFKQLNLPGVRLRLAPGLVRGLILSNSPVRGDLDLALTGPDSETLAQAGRQVIDALDAMDLARFRPDADPRQPELQIRPDWERMARVNLTVQDLGATVETAIAGTVATRVQRGNRLVDVRVRLDRQNLRQTAQLEQLPLFVENNRQIRLRDVARIEEGRAPGEIQRVNQREVFLIVGDLSEGAKLSDAFTQVKAALANLDLPSGVRFLPSQSEETSSQLQSSLRLLGGLAAFLVFVVMAVQYNTLIDPLVIMVTVPLALAGGVLGLYITQTAIGLTVLVGAVLLVGIVVNNAIIMVEFANQIRQEQGIGYEAAILQAAPQRLRPIMMTTITTVLGMLPLAMGVGEGSEFLQPLGVVVFSGLSLATLLTLFIIPCTYTLFHQFKLH